jgi:glucose/arabinose dehydrogenase
MIVGAAGWRYLSNRSLSRPPGATDLGVTQSRDARFRLEVVAGKLQQPVSLAFLPDGRALLAERPNGRLALLEPASGRRTLVRGVPPVHGVGYGGLLDVAVHPEFASTGWIYLAYSAPVDSGTTTVVDRARLEADSLVGRERLFTAYPALKTHVHYGGRLLLHDGYLFITVGDRDTRTTVQDLSTHLGKVHRIHDDGRVPTDNPLAATAGARPEIWTLGHRNPQGLALDRATGRLWLSEHGPRGGDEVNLLIPGRNYGWPLVSWGRDYGGEPIGDGRTEREGIESPAKYWRVRLPPWYGMAPSGLVFYDGAVFPGWRGSLFLGMMGRRLLDRLMLDGARVTGEERLLSRWRWRVREVRQSPEGFLYIGVDEGLLLRLRPEDL